MSSVKDDMREVKTSIHQIADALTKLAILEDRQATQLALVEKTLARLESLEEKQHVIEIRMAATGGTGERLTSLERSVGDIGTRVTSYEAAGKALGGGAKVLWAIAGAVGSAVAFLFSTGKVG